MFSTTDLVVIGGGPAGMTAAISAARAQQNAHIILLEHGPRVGKKLLSTGNGRCNLTNSHAAPAFYHGGNQGFFTSVLDRYPSSRILDFSPI